MDIHTYTLQYRKYIEKFEENYRRLECVSLEPIFNNNVEGETLAKFFPKHSLNKLAKNTKKKHKLFNEKFNEIDKTIRVIKGKVLTL